jgi:septal ring factor EnvC (AmiA/AmiB activator)
MEKKTKTEKERLSLFDIILEAVEPERVEVTMQKEIDQRLSTLVQEKEHWEKELEQTKEEYSKRVKELSTKIKTLEQTITENREKLEREWRLTNIDLFPEELRSSIIENNK